MSRGLGDKAHGRAKQQREDDQNTHCIEGICCVDIDTTGTGVSSGAGVGVGVGVDVPRVTGQMIHCHDGDDEQDEDDKGDEDVDELVDARAAVEGDVFV